MTMEDPSLRKCRRPNNHIRMGWVGVGGCVTQTSALISLFLTSSCHRFISPSIIVCIVLWLYSVLDFLFYRFLVLIFSRVFIRSCSCYSVLLVCDFLGFSVYWSPILPIPMFINYSFLQFAIFQVSRFIDFMFFIFADLSFTHLANYTFRQFLLSSMYRNIEFFVYWFLVLLIYHFSFQVISRFAFLSFYNYGSLQFCRLLVSWLSHCFDFPLHRFWVF